MRAFGLICWIAATLVAVAAAIRWWSASAALLIIGLGGVIASAVYLWQLGNDDRQ